MNISVATNHVGRRVGAGITALVMTCSVLVAVMGTQIAGIGPSGATTSPCAATDASHFSVTTTADSGPGSFRQAMSDAQSANGGTICVSPDLGTISLSSAISYTGTGQLTILGNGATLDGGGVTALLRLQGPMTRDPMGPQWTALTLVLTGLNFSNASVADDGAALWLNAVDASITDATFTGNQATSRHVGGAIAAYYQHNHGGHGPSGPPGSSCQDCIGSLHVVGSSFLNNSATCDCAENHDGGGAIEVSYGSQGSTTLIESSSFTGNSSTGPGGAINGGGPDLTVLNSTFVENVSSADGGAIYDYGSSPNVAYSTFLGNQAASGSAISAIQGQAPQLYANVFFVVSLTASLCDLAASASGYNYANEAANSCGLSGVGDSSLSTNDPQLGILSTGPGMLQWMTPGPTIRGLIPNAACNDPYLPQGVSAATDELGFSRPSTPGVSCTPGAIGEIPPPTGLTAIAGNGSALVSWLSPAYSNVSYYDIEAVPTTGSTVSQLVASTHNAANVMGLVNGVSYSVTVTAMTSEGPSIASTAVLVTPAGVLPNLPGAPTITQTFSTATSVSISWTAGTAGDDPTLFYELSIIGGANNRLLMATSNTIAWKFSDLAPSTSYVVVVTPVAANGAGASSAPATILTKAAPLKATAPSAPTHLSAKAQGQRLSVSWQAPRSLGGAPITRYRVTLSPGGASCTTTGALHCVITHVNTQRYYRVSVRATNTAGLSPAASVTKVRG